MNNLPRWLLSVLLLFAGSNILFAEKIQGFNSSLEILTISSGIEVYEDASGVMDFEAIKKQSFETLEGNSPRRGNKLGAIWVKFIIENSTDLEHLVLLLEEPALDRVELFQVKSDANVVRQVIEKKRIFKERNYKDPNYLFDLYIPNGSAETIFLKINSKSIIHVPLYVGSVKNILEKLKVKNLWYFIYMGLMIGLILYNFFIFISTRQFIYLRYLVYMLTVLLAQISVQGGYAFQYLWPNIPYLAIQSVYIFPVLSGIAAIGFVRNFLQTGKHLPVMDKIFTGFVIVYVICLVAAFIGLDSIAYRAIELTAMGISFYLIFVGVVMYRKGNRDAKFFLLAWSFFLGGVTIFLLKEMGVLPYNNWTKYAMPVGSAIEGLLLSLALADRLNFFKRAKEKAEEETEELFGKFKEKLIKERSLEKENFELQMTNLRSQMNPHFIFNSLGSIQYYIQTRKVEEADEYLTKFAQLMRSYLDSSVENEISIRKEVALLKDYISLEQMRFDKKFSLDIKVDPKIDQDDQVIPTMLIQPIVENAINHGLQSREGNNGLLEITFRALGENVECVILDNGIGISKNLSKHKKSHTSRSTQNIKDRMVALENLGRAKIGYQSKEIFPGEKYPGTEVVITITHI